MKRCSHCGKEKEFDQFTKAKRRKDGLSGWCKDCTKEKNSNYYKRNKKKISKATKNWYENNLEKCRGYKRKYYYKNSEKMIETSKQWNKENPEKHCKHVIKSNKKRYNNDPLYRLACSVRKGVARVTDAVKQQKELRSLEYLGCSLDEFKKHIESLWLEGMTWDNHGHDGWHIDHIVPLDYFVKNEDDPWEANHYKNLQPLWAEENFRKGISI